MAEVDRPPVKLDGEAASPDLRAEVSMTCFFGNCDHAETYGAADLSLTLIGTGATRSLYMLTAHEAGTRWACSWPPQAPREVAASFAQPSGNLAGEGFREGLSPP